MAVKLSEAVIEAMSEIDSRYLEESEREPKKAFAWKPVLSFAAVFSMIIGLIILRPMSSNSGGAPAAPLTGTSLSNEKADTEAAAAEEGKDDLTESAALSFRIDEELWDALEDVSDDSEVTVIMETITEKDGVLYSEEETVTMTKQEILSFEGETGKTYIFHLAHADEME
jgi:hypothetical protein